MAVTSEPAATAAANRGGAPAWYDSLDSFEGVPNLDWFSPRIPRESRKKWQRVAHDALVWVAGVLPGVALAAALALAGFGLSHAFAAVVHLTDSPVSPILFAVFLGLLIRNTMGVPSAYEAGLKFCLRTVLRVGIVLLGLRLTIGGFGSLALVGLPVIVACVAVALLTVTWVTRVAKLPRRLGALIAVGTSICGVSAIVATAPAIDAEDDEVSYAVGCITVFGMIALITYPFFAHFAFGGDPQLAGLFLGTAIHDTSQVAGAGLMYEQLYQTPGALRSAVAIKLVRNVCMAVVIPIVAISYHRSRGSRSPRRLGRWHQAVPLFVLGFLAMVAIASVCEWSQHRYGVPNAGVWKRIQDDSKMIAGWCLAAAMAAVGLGTGLAKLRGLGWKPLSLACAAALLVGGVSVLLIKLLAPVLATLRST